MMVGNPRYNPTVICSASTHGGLPFTIRGAFVFPASVPSGCSPLCQTKMKGSDRGFGVVSRACKAGALPAELHIPAKACKLNRSIQNYLEAVAQPWTSHSN